MIGKKLRHNKLKSTKKSAGSKPVFVWNHEECNSYETIFPSLLKMIGNKQKTILDIGCGNGFLANELIGRGHKVFGLDPSPSGIKIAKKKNPNNFFVWQLEDVKLPSAISKIDFDIIVSTEVIEHLVNPDLFFKLCAHIFKKNKKGELIVSTPYHGYLKNLSIALLGKNDGHYSPLENAGHIKFWSKNTLERILTQYNFVLVDFKGCGRVWGFWKSMMIKARLKP